MIKLPSRIQNECNCKPNSGKRLLYFESNKENKWTNIQTNHAKRYKMVFGKSTTALFLPIAATDDLVYKKVYGVLFFSINLNKFSPLYSSCCIWVAPS
jgi:hypothetical protein